MSVAMFYPMKGETYAIEGELCCRDVPWNKNSPTMLLKSPKLPTMTINFGLLTSRRVEDADILQYSI